MKELTEELSRILSAASKSAYDNSANHGFWSEGGAFSMNGYAAKIALMHSELSELLEALRKDPKARCEKVPEITCEEEEAADLFIRLLDYCYARNIDLGRATVLKHEYNLSRPYKHGKRI